jgi:glucosamine--fructose-6-phosphate aminotransferase (isomerizing)
MCGIVGYIGNRSCIDIIYKGLQRLEYRGYDSAGIAVLKKNEISMVKSEGKLAKLEASLSELPQDASRGIGHTRWATHGIPDTINAHPHVDGSVALVHNGIIENYLELKAELQKEGVPSRGRASEGMRYAWVAVRPRRWQCHYHRQLAPTNTIQ